jgi:hypothetical protein
MGLGGQRHASTALTPGKNTGIHHKGRWVGPKTGLDGYGEIFRATAIETKEF